jgi:uncharacterized protein
MAETAGPLTDAEMAELERCLDQIGLPLEPLDLMMLDGYLCGVLLQPTAVPEAQWLRHVTDVDGRALPGSVNPARLHALVRKRHAELNRAIHSRLWFDPWVFEMEDEAEPLETVMPWAAGFAMAMELFPALTRIDSPDVLEPLAVLYRSFDPDDLEDADALLAMIESLEPPQDLAEAVESLVSSTMLLADVSRPQHSGPGRTRPGAAGARRPAGRAARPAGVGTRGGKPGPRR